MDEPTAALSKPGNVGELYRITEKLKAEGTSIVFISPQDGGYVQAAQTRLLYSGTPDIGTWDVDKISKD